MNDAQLAELRRMIPSDKHGKVVHDLIDLIADLKQDVRAAEDAAATMRQERERDERLRNVRWLPVPDNVPAIVCEFEIPVPMSSKNARRARKLPDGRIIQFRPKEVVDCTKSIQAFARVAMLERGSRMAEDDEISVAMVHHVDIDRVSVQVCTTGHRPTHGPTGRKRDVANMPELVLDAMQGIVYTNDRQVGALSVRRYNPRG